MLTTRKKIRHAWPGTTTSPVPIVLLIHLLGRITRPRLLFSLVPWFCSSRLDPSRCDGGVINLPPCGIAQILRLESPTVETTFKICDAFFNGSGLQCASLHRWVCDLFLGARYLV